MRLENMQKEFPKMPEELHEMIEKEVAEQLKTPYVHGKKKNRYRKVLIAAAACMTLGCCVAAASGQPAFRKWLSLLGINQKAAEELIDIEPEAIYEEKQPLLLIREVYLDGTKFIFRAEAGAGAGFIPLESKDHALINGTDCLVEYFRENPEGSGYYEGCIVVPEKLEGETLRVEMKLYTKSGIRDFKFEVEISDDHLSASRDIATHKILLESGFAEVQELKLAPSSQKLKLYYEFFGTDAERLCKLYGRGFYKIRDSHGNTLDSLYGMMVEVADRSSDGQGNWSGMVTLQMKNFDISSDEMIIIPYEPEYDSEGKVIPDSETVQEELAFSISLQ